MDDMKRAMYIAVRNTIQRREGWYICLGLKDELRDEGWDIDDMYSHPKGHLDLDRTMEELFSEVYELFDFTFWSDAFPKRTYNDNVHSSWFRRLDKKRRLDVLDFIIANR